LNGLDLFSVDADVQVSYRHHYDARQKKWTRSLINVIVKAEPFAEGAMRTAHHMQDLSVSASFLARMRRTTSPFSR
jgi:hypothetical protein